MKQDLIRVVAGSAAVCLASWFALSIGAGNIGLQRSISKGAGSLFEQPATVVLVAAVAFAMAYGSAKVLGVGALPLLVGVLLGDVFAGAVLAPLAVGELEPIHAPLVFAAVSVLGIQPIGALLGALMAGQTRVTFPHAD